MSHAAYNQQWHDAHQTINELIKVELPEEPDKPERDRTAVFQKLATLFIKYVQIFRKLEACYDQIVHPQKRLILKQVLDGTMGRILEVKDEMVRLESSQYHFFEDVLSDLKLTPDDIEIPIPRYFINNYKTQLKERERLLSNILDKIKPGDTKGQPKEMTIEEAVRLIQINERARQGRLRAKFMKEIRTEEERERRALERGPPTLDANVAATRIQRIWKGFVQRKITKRERQEEMIFIGMEPGPDGDIKRSNPFVTAVKTEESRRVVQEENDIDYKQALVTTKEQIREMQGPDMKEMMQDQIRQWFIECRDLTGKLPDYPDAAIGGSAFLFRDKTPEEVEEEMRLKAEEEENNKGKKKKKGKKEKKKKKGKKKKGKKGKGKDKADEEEENPGWKMTESKFLGPLRDGHVDYNKVWRNRDEHENFSQKHDVQLIKEEKRIEVEAEVRLQVDELMRKELDNLKMAIDRVKSKKKKGKKKKGKKKKKKGKKGKKGKDLTAGRTIESLFEELIQQGILVRSPHVRLQDYLGDFNYLATILRQKDIEPQPALSDVRQLVTLYGILPLGSAEVHQNMPQIKSILLAGPRGVGKKFLIHAMCTEAGANLFDLSAGNIVGKYPGKTGLALLLQSVMRVAKELQPSVIYIGDCERTFMKKAPKGDKTDPKRLKKDLPKLLKQFKPEDRVLLVGTSREPFNAPVKPFCKCYQRLIMIPRPDYASRRVLWTSLIQKHGGIITPSLDISSLIKITDGYTPGHILEAIKYTLSERRVADLSKKPLQAVEFVTPLSRIDPIYREEEEAFQKWHKKTPLGKARKKMLDNDGEPEDGKAKGKKGKGKKGKKGKKKKK